MVLQSTSSHFEYDLEMKIEPTGIGNLEVLPLRVFKKNSGKLAALEIAKNVPWPIQRIFFISSVSSEHRGNHAHKECTQLIVCISGTVLIRCQDGMNQMDITLSDLDSSLLVPPGIWVELQMGPNTSIAVITDLKYDEDDYINKWDDFLKFRGLV